MIGLSPSFIENLEAGFVFWIFDVVIIVLLLPTVLDRIQRRKWLPMRRALVANMDRFLERTATAMQHVSRRGGLQTARINLAPIEEAYRARLDILLPAVDPDLSQKVVEALDRIDRVQLLARRFSDDLGYALRIFCGDEPPLESQAAKRDNYRDSLERLIADLDTELRGFAAMVQGLGERYGLALHPRMSSSGKDGVLRDDLAHAAENLRVMVARIFYDGAERRGLGAT